MHQEAEDGRGNSQVPEHGAITSDQGVIVLARPPIVYLASILAGFGLNAVWPVEVFPRAIKSLGGLLTLVPVALFVLSARAFRTDRTPIRSTAPVLQTIAPGPQRPRRT